MPLCSWLPDVPANARAGIVLLKRPCTFVVALVLGAVGALTALFCAVTKFHPPACPCEETPRTRPRPTPLRPASAEPPQTTLESLHSLVTAPFRPATRRPPPARRHSGRKHGDYPVHELDGVLEAREEEEEEAEAATEARGRDGRSSPVREGSDDTSSEADTLVDADAAEAMEARAKAGKAKGVKAGLVVLTHGLRWMTPHALAHGYGHGHEHAHAKKGEAGVVASPVTYDHSESLPSPPSTEIPTTAAVSSASRKGPCPIKALRHRAATCSHPPRSPSAAPALPARRVASDGRDYFSHASGPSSSSGDTTPSMPDLHVVPTPADVHAHLSAPKTRKRASTSLFFRSLSPRSRSPATTPEGTPPPSPRLSPTEHSTSFQPGPRLGVHRASSLDAAPVSVSGNRRRTRSPAPQRPPLVASKPSSNAEIDMRGSSGLALSDVLPQSFRA